MNKYKKERGKQQTALYIDVYPDSNSTYHDNNLRVNNQVSTSYKKVIGPLKNVDKTAFKTVLLLLLKTITLNHYI